jgi:Cu2+-exporting ATPase
MFIVNVVIAGGVLYAGIKTFIKHRPKKNSWLRESVRQKANLSGSETDQDGFLDSEGQDERKFQRDLAISSVSLGMSVSGLLFYSPLGPASVPLTIYGSIPVFERAFEVIFGKARGKMRPIGLSVISLLVVIGSLATEHYTVASLIDWLRSYLTLLARRVRDINQSLLYEFADNYRQPFYHSGPQPQSVWVQGDGVAIETPFEELKIGDVVVVNASEMVPVNGLIVEGNARINRFNLTGRPHAASIRAGDRVSAFTVVRSGRICVQVENV